MKKILLTIFIWLMSTAPTQAVALINPIGGTPDAPAGQLDPRVVVGQIVKTALGVIGSIALLIFIYGGVRFIFSFGDSSKIADARNTLIWAAVGLVVIFSSYALANFALNLATGGN